MGKTLESGGSGSLRWTLSSRPETREGQAPPPVASAVDGGEVLRVRGHALADYRPVSEAVQEGDVLLVDRQIRGLLKPGDRQAIHAAWEEIRRAFETVHAPVATSGIVRANVDATYGAVRVGDLLTASPTRGCAMRASEPAAGTVVGKAREPLTDGKGSIEILVILR